MESVVWFGQKDVVKFLLKEYEATVCTTDNYGWTALHHAAQNGNVNVIEMLLNYVAELSIVCNELKFTTLQAAVAAGQTDIIDFLIPQYATEENSELFWDSLLSFAVKNAQFDTATIILTTKVENICIMTNLKKTIVDAFVFHWDQQLADGQPISPGQNMLALQLHNSGYPLNVNTLIGAEKRQQTINNLSVNNNLRNLRFYEYVWIPVKDEFKTWIISQLQTVDGKYKLNSSTTHVELCNLDWYDECQLIRLTNSRTPLNINNGVRKTRKTTLRQSGVTHLTIGQNSIFLLSNN